VLCTFCNLRGRRAKEHVIPDWINQEIGGTPPWFDDQYDPLAESVTKTRNLGGKPTWRYPDVCHTCNTESLSTLEELAKPLLLPMIRGHRVMLDPIAQGVVALWSIKTALMYDAYRPPRRVRPEWGTHILWRDRKPTPHTQVLLGAYAPQPRNSRLHAKAHANVHATIPDDKSIDFQLVRVTLTSGRPFLIVDFLVGESDRRSFPQFRRINRGLTRIWPIESPVEWPPGLVFDFAGGRLVAGEGTLWHSPTNS
jgi:hypothetical protein